MDIRFVRDEAAKDDFFGGHKKLADTLVQLVDHPDALRLIGLLGTWGSGKSTVLKLAAQQLSDPNREPETIVFTFDAWMHQGDPPRRAFIEAFIQFLVREKICPGETWENELADVQRRVETHEINSTPTLSPWGIGIALSLLTLPLGIRLTGESDFLEAAGWFLVALPFGIAAANWWWWRPIRNPLNAAAFFKPKNLSKNRAPYEARSITSVFVNKTTDKTTNRILKTPEPTSIEFRQTFSSILKKIAARGAKFVFVLDNLDRIAPDDALNIWSTFRSLFASTGGIADSVGLSFSVVIPLDYFSLSRLYKPRAEEKDSAERVQSLIDKSFDVVLRVGPPVQSDWSAYLQEKLNFAFFGGLNEEELHIGRSIYRSYLEHKLKTSRVTPRDVNSYVNAVAALYMQREKEIPFASICYYACFSAQGEEFDIGSVLAVDAPAASVISRLDPDWRTGVSALHFGVAPDRALQILVGDKVVAAVTNEEEEAFLKLEKIPGFEGVLEQLLRAEETRPPSFYAKLAGLLSPSSAGSVIGREIWSAIVAECSSAKDWDFLSSLTAKGLGQVVLHGVPGTATRLITTLSGEEQSFEQVPATWLENIKSVVSNAAPDDLSLKSLAVPHTPDFYLATLTAAKESEVEQNLYTNLRPAADRSSVMEALAKHLKDNDFDEPSREAIARLSDVPIQWPWAAVIASAEAAVGADEDQDAITGALRTLITLRAQAASTLEGLGRSGHLASVFYDAWQEDSDIDVGATLGAIAVGWPDVSIVTHYSNSSDGQDILHNLDALEEEQKARFTASFALVFPEAPADMLRGALAWAASYANSRTTIYRAIRQFFRDGLVEKLYPLELARSAPQIIDAGGKDGQEIVRRASSYGRFWSHVSSELPLEDISKIILAVGTATLDSETVQSISKLAAAKDEGYWSQAIEDNSPALQMVDKLLADGKALSIGSGIRKAYSSHMSRVATGASSLSRDISWNRLVEASEPKGLAEALADLLDMLATVDNPSRLRLLETFDDAFLADRTVVSAGDRFAQVMLLPLFVDDDEECATSVVERASAIAPLARRFRKATKLDLSAKIERLVGRGTIAAERAAEIEALWRLKVEPRKPRKETRPRPKKRGQKS